MNDDPALPPLLRFRHEAMNSYFEVIVAGQEEKYARSAAHEIFEKIDWLEGKLSRFIENSEIARLNALAGRAAVKLAPETLECLRVALNVAAVTGGAFDVTVGALLQIWRPVGGSPRQPAATDLAGATALTGMHLLTLDEENLEARLGVPGAAIDLGAIGKGYAIDCAVRILREWEIDTALVHCESTTFGLGAPAGFEGWPVGVGHGAADVAPEARRLALRDMALSASGTEIRGEHILDPRTGRPPVARAARAWSLNPSATVADALSTAFMVMTPEEVEAVCGQFSDVGAMLLLERDGSPQLRCCGAWPGQ